MRPQVEAITIRGYDNRFRPNADVSKYPLPVNLLADYCPTDRYLYIKKKMPKIKLRPTWLSFKGRLFQDIYKDMYAKSKEYLTVTPVNRLDFEHFLQEYMANLPNEIITLIEKEKQTFVREPSSDEIDEFLNQITSLARYEIGLFSAHMNFLVSKKYHINLAAEFENTFNFLFEYPLNGTKIGLTDNVTPDFIYLRSIIGDIKTEAWEEFFRVMIAAYAMAYEASEDNDMNFGIVLNPTFHLGRSIPLYRNSEIFIVDDILRKAFLTKREQKWHILLRSDIPNKPDTQNTCQQCGYSDYCWSEGKT